MPRHSIFISIPVVLTAITISTLPLFAHEGHGKGEVAPFDLDTPRTVSPETAAHIDLQTAEIDFGSVEETIRLRGVVRPMPERVQSIATRVDGAVVFVAVQVGDVVNKGDLLAEMDSPSLLETIYELRKLETDYFALQSSLIGARSRIDELTVKLDTGLQHAAIAQAEYERLDHNNGAVAVNVLSEKQAAAVRAQGEARLYDIELTLARQTLASMSRQAKSMDQSKMALENVIATMSNTNRSGTKDRVASSGSGFSLAAARENEQAERVGSIRYYSPIDGVVIERDVMAGQGINAGDSLLTIAEYSRVQIEGELPESLVYRAGEMERKPVRIRRIAESSANSITTGTVRFISPVIDPVKRTTHVIVEADNPGGLLRDGLYVDLVVVLRKEESAVVVPISAVVNDGPLAFVFIKNGEFYVKQDINPGAQDDQVVEVLDGLLPGDVVVTRGAYSLTQLRPKAPVASSDDSSAG